MITEIYHGQRTQRGCVVTVDGNPLSLNINLARKLIHRGSIVTLVGDRCNGETARVKAIGRGKEPGIALDIALDGYETWNIYDLAVVQPVGFDWGFFNVGVSTLNSKGTAKSNLHSLRFLSN